MTPDPFRHYDAAYVLGALSPGDRRAFEQHLEVCPDCSRAVGEVAGLPGLLAAVHPSVLEEEAPPVPASLLEGVLARRRRERTTRRRWLVGVAAGVAAAAVAVALVVLPLSGPDPAQAVSFSQVVPSPIHATADLHEKDWGTRIDLDCSYDGGSGSERVSYGLVVTAADGHREHVGTWWVAPGESISLTASTDVRVADLARVAIIGPAGSELLRATP